MRQYKMVVLSNPVPGREQECDDWYQNVHLHEMVTLRGFKSAQRFRLAHPMRETEPFQFMAIYEIETDAIDESLQGLVSAAESGRLNLSGALHRENAYAVVYEACGDAVKAT